MGEQQTALKDLIGETSVLDAPEILESYSTDNSFTNPMKPRQVVKVKNVDEVQKIVQWANKTRTPLVPISSGPPHFRGDTVPSMPEAVIVDLSGMKKIININARNRMAIIEPGVTYEELQASLAKEGLTLSTSLAPRKNKSVIASLLETEPRTIPAFQWCYIEPLRCMEIVWGDGNKIWTGEAGNAPLSLETQWNMNKWQVIANGGANIDFFRIVSGAQGSMGIVTWASVKCLLMPKIHKLYFATAQKPGDLLDFTYRLLKIRFGDELMIMNSTYLASLLGESPEHIQALKDELPRWTTLVGITGRDLLPAERIEYQEKDIQDIAQMSGLNLLPAISDVTGTEVLETISNPSKEPYWKLRYKGGFQDIFFVTTLDKTPEFIATMYSVADELGFPTSDIGVYLQPQHQGASCHCEFNIPYNPDDKKEAKKAQELYVKASEELFRKGAFFARPYGIWADMAFNADAQNTMMLKKIKNIFDPNHVMNPGRLCF